MLDYVLPSGLKPRTSGVICMDIMSSFGLVVSLQQTGYLHFAGSIPILPPSFVTSILSIISYYIPSIYT